MIKSKRVALIYRAASLLFAIAGVLSLTGVFKGEFNANVLFYYTAQSNILAIILFVMLTGKTIAELRKSNRNSACFYPRFALIVAINCMLTFVVFWVLLVPAMGDGGIPLWTFFNLSVHAVTPLLCLIDYLLFSQPRRMKYRDIYYTTIFPLLYSAFATIAGLLGHVFSYTPDGTPVRAPYFFLSFDAIGFSVFIYAGALLVFFMLIGHGLYFIDRKVRKPKSA